jgi:hypothetical protein
MIRVRQSRARVRLRASSDALSMIYLGAADNRAVVFAVIKLSCSRWHDVIGVVRKSQRRKAKATLNDVTMVAVTEDAIQLAGLNIGIHGFDGDDPRTNG